jgi:hypothetical protein
MGTDLDIASKWNRLVDVCQRLEILAHKQLRQVPFNAEENGFLKNYGKQLANIMLYGGNSYFNPRDDAPRIVDVFTNPTIDEDLRVGIEKHLLVGTGKPRFLWVLYPVKGKEFLCRGAVLPYHEFPHPQRLTDAAWKTLLNSPQCPEPPAWIQPLIGEDGTGDPEKGK